MQQAQPRIAQQQSPQNTLAMCTDAQGGSPCAPPLPRVAVAAAPVPLGEHRVDLAAVVA